MKPLFIIALILLIAGLSSQAACKRKPDGGADASTGGVTAGPDDRSRASSLVESGKELYRTDQDEKAVEAFKEAVKLDPDMPEAHFRLGLAYDAVGQETEAEEEYKKAIERYKKYLATNSKDAEAHYNLGQAYAGLHLYSEAVREYRQATRLKSDDSDIYYDLGMALSKLANYDEAVSAFSKAIEIDPENYRAVDALEEARDGVKRINAGKRHQEDLLKKKKGANSNDTEGNSNSNSQGNSNSSNRPRPRPRPKPSQ